MSMTELSMVGKSTKKWEGFIDLKNSIDSSFGQMRAVITELESDEVFIKNVSAEEEALISKYKEISNMK